MTSEAREGFRLLSDADLDAIRARADAATRGPWEAHTAWFGSDVGDYEASWIPGVCEREWGGYDVEESAPLYPDDAKFVAHARTDVPALLDEVERLRERCADLTLSLTYSDHELEEHVAPEIHRLREQVETLQTERSLTLRMARLAYTAQAELRMDTPEDEATRLRVVQMLREGMETLALPATEKGPTP